MVGPARDMTSIEVPSDRSEEDRPGSSIEHAVEVARRLGFCLLKGFFDPREIAAWEHAALALDENDRKRDFLSHGYLDSLLFDERVLTFARSLIGPKLVYY